MAADHCRPLEGHQGRMNGSAGAGWQTLSPHKRQGWAATASLLFAPGTSRIQCVVLFYEYPPLYLSKVTLTVRWFPFQTIVIILCDSYQWPLHVLPVGITIVFIMSFSRTRHVQMETINAIGNTLMLPTGQSFTRRFTHIGIQCNQESNRLEENRNLYLYSVNQQGQSYVIISSLLQTRQEEFQPVWFLFVGSVFLKMSAFTGHMSNGTHTPLSNSS